MSTIADFSKVMTSQRTVQDWELTINGKEVRGEYMVWYDEYGDTDWDVKIENQSQLTDDEIDQINDYIRENI